MLTSVFIQNSCFLFFDGIKAWISEMILENKMAKCLEILREICFVVIVT